VKLLPQSALCRPTWTTLRTYQPLVVLLDGTSRAYIGPSLGLPADLAGSVLADRSESLCRGSQFILK
jgi:hypothetical protein